MRVDTVVLRGIFLAAMLMLLGFAAAADDVYILGPGDKIRITVFGNEDVSGDVEIDPSGQVSLPLIQKVPAAGKSVAQLQDDIFARLSPDFIKSPKITIEILTYRPFYIYGEVQRPGSYPYAAGMTVVNAVAVAGGFTYRADKDDIVISRGTGDGRKTFRADRTDTVKPGDVLEIKERYF